jgi:DNA-binding response OmpR family regulator
MINSNDVSILVVDDDYNIRRVVIEILEAKGYTCFEASSGSHALEILKNMDFDLMITDIMMPGISGIKLLTTVRQQKPDMAVIMLTSVDKMETAIYAIDQGAYCYMIKPFQINELLINVYNVLYRCEQEKRRYEYEKGLESQIYEYALELRKHKNELISERINQNDN